MDASHAPKILGLDGLFLRRRREQRLGERIEPRARAGSSDALYADPRALDQEEQLLGEALRPGITRLAHERDQPFALAALLQLDHPPRRMLALGQLDRRVGERAAAPARLGGKLRHALEEIAQLGVRLARMRIARRFPQRLALFGQLA